MYQLETTRQKATMVIALPEKGKTIEMNEPSAERALHSRLRKLAWLGAILALLGTGAYFRQQSSAESAASMSQAQVAVRRVNVTMPQRLSADAITLPATVQAYQATDLFARANGFLKVWHFDIGARVNRGQVLAEIETPELDQELAQAVALLTQGRAEQQQAVAELEEAKAEVALAEANIVKATANLNFSVVQARRYQGLANLSSISREEFDGAIRDRDARKAEVDSTTAELARRKSNLITRQAIIESRQAVVGNREANVQRLRDLTGFQKIVAPFAGIVTRRSAEVGMLVTSGSSTGTQPLFSVAEIDVLRVRAAVPQSSALGIKPGDQAQVIVPEKPGQSFPVRVARTAGAVEPMSRSLLVEVELPNRDNVLLPGMYAQVRFQSFKEQAAWVIPAKALLMRSDGPHVVIVTSAGALQIRNVSLGRDFGSTIEVLVGLRGDERLVVNPSDDLRDAQVVEVVDRT